VRRVVARRYYLSVRGSDGGRAAAAVAAVEAASAPLAPPPPLRRRQPTPPPPFGSTATGRGPRRALRVTSSRVCLAGGSGQAARRGDERQGEAPWEGSGEAICRPSEGGAVAN